MKVTAAILVSISLLACAKARAEEPEIFSKKPFAWREDERDKRLMKTKIIKAMESVPKNAACARVISSLLAAFAEATPYFQKKDDRFPMFSVFTAPMTTERFPANDFLLHMLRRATIDGKAPEAWLSTAKQLKAKYKAPIDLARLAYAVDGLQPIDSIDFGVALFLNRYQTEVTLAPTVAQASAMERFREKFLDRDVAWSGLVLADIYREKRAAPKKSKTTGGDSDNDGPRYIATFIVPGEHKQTNILSLDEKPAQDLMRIRVKLAPEQYVDVKKMVVSEKYLVHARLFEFSSAKMKSAPMSIEMRDGLIFEDRDWSTYGGFATAEDAENCDLCMNDLSPLGLKEVQGVGTKDGFSR